MNSFNNMFGGFCSAQENVVEAKQQQQVWPHAVQNQNFGNTSCCAVKSQNNNSFDTQISALPSPFREGATEADWDAFLLGVSRPVQDASAQRSALPNPFREGATEADWDAFLVGLSHPVQNASTPVPSSSFVEPEVAQIRPPKKHYAHITFVPSADGLKPVVSRKRRRTAFTTEQVTALEGVFKYKPYVTREERSVLVQRLAVGDQAIKVWFQNRRLKQKKEIEEEIEARICPEHNMFAQTELLMHQVEKNGCVALNQQSIDELVNAIDAFLPKDLDLGKLIGDSGRSVETIVGSHSADVIHEPISPPEVGSSEPCCAPDWWNGEVDPKKSLQYLLDLQT